MRINSTGTISGAFLSAVLTVCCVGCGGRDSASSSGNAQTGSQPAVAWQEKFIPEQQQARTHTVKVLCLTPVAPADGEKTAANKDDAAKDNAAKDNAAKDNAAKDNAPPRRATITVNGQGRVNSARLTGDAGKFDGRKAYAVVSDETRVTIYGNALVEAASGQTVQVVFDEGTANQTTVTITGAGRVRLWDDAEIALYGAADFDVKSNVKQAISVGESARAKIEGAGKVHCHTAIVETTHCQEVEGGASAAVKATQCGKVTVDGEGPNYALDCGHVVARWKGVAHIRGKTGKSEGIWGGTIKNAAE